MKPANKRPIGLEDLLRLRKTERPPEGFWSEFDRQLRAKQLAALMQRPPWWQALTLDRILAGWRRYHLPLGATAVVALAVISIRVNQTRVAEGPVGPETVAAVQVHSDFVPGNLDRGAVAPVGAGGEVAVVEAAVRPATGLDAPAVAADLTTASGSVSHLIPLLGVPMEDRPEVTASSASIYADPAFGAAAGETLVGQTLLSSAAQIKRVEARAVTARPAVEPLQQITPPSERRGTRILTAMVSMASVETAMRATERAASRLSEEQLYEEIRRFGARGAGVNVKF